jgi:hypothetical protein
VLSFFSHRKASSAQEVLSPPLPNLEFTTYTGVAVHSPVGKHLGIIPNRDHLFLGIHPTWMLRAQPTLVHSLGA